MSKKYRKTVLLNSVHKKGFHTIKSQNHSILDSCEKAAESCPVKIIVVKDV